jgi:peptidyl-prolyl cis-trans isomerase B (cyclophilin B)
MLAGILVLAVALTGCGQDDKAASSDETSKAASADTSSAAADDEEEKNMNGVAGAGNPVVQIEMEDGGVITLELYPDKAPKTVENFLKLVNEGFYDGLTFHRVIPNFMIQGGDPLGNGTGGSSDKIEGEFSSNGFATNDISHERGVISMARSSSPNSASCQFFITNDDATFLDGDYAAFGRVTDGMDVVDQISAVETDSNDKPLEPVVIKTIRQIS